MSSLYSTVLLSFGDIRVKVMVHQSAGCSNVLSSDIDSLNTYRSDALPGSSMYIGCVWICSDHAVPVRCAGVTYAAYS